MPSATTVLLACTWAAAAAAGAAGAFPGELGGSGPSERPCLTALDAAGGCWTHLPPSDWGFQLLCAGGRALQAGGADLLESAALAWSSARPSGSRTLPAAVAAAGTPPPPGNAATALERLTGDGSSAATAAPSQSTELDLPMSLEGAMPPAAVVDAAPAGGSAATDGGAAATATPAQFATRAAIVLTEANDTAAAEAVTEAAALAFAAGQPAAAVAFAQVSCLDAWVGIRLAGLRAPAACTCIGPIG